MVNFLQLTKSRLRQKILSYYFTNPTNQLYVRQLASILREDPGNLSKELSRLENEGIFIAETKGNQKHFYLNKRYPLYNELKSILFKTVGVEGRLKVKSSTSELADAGYQMDANKIYPYETPDS